MYFIHRAYLKTVAELAIHFALRFVILLTQNQKELKLIQNCALVSNREASGNDAVSSSRSRSVAKAEGCAERGVGAKYTHNSFSVSGFMPFKLFVR